MIKNLDFFLVLNIQMAQNFRLIYYFFKDFVDT
jgi:hypothetical protein